MAINPLQPPTNYMAMLPQVDLGQKFAEFGQALAQRQQREAALNVQKQYAADLQSTLDNPNQKAWSTLIAKYPSQREAFKEAQAGFAKEQLSNEFNQGSEISMALESKNPEVAKALVQRSVDARKNSGQPTGIYEQVLDALNSGNVKGAQAGVNMALSLLDPEKFQKMVESRGAAAAAPDKLRAEGAAADKAVAAAKIEQANATNAEEKAAADAALATANAKKAKVEAKYAEPNSILDLEKKGWDIKKVKEDIDINRRNSSIAALNAQISKETNNLKRNELLLKSEDLQRQRDETIRAKTAEVETGAATADNLINTVDKVLSASIKSKDAKGNPTAYTSTIRSATGPIESLIFTTDQDVANLEENVKTLGSQITMSRIGEMKGALSDKDLETLRTSLQSISLRQSPEQLVKNLLEAQRLTLKARKTLTNKFGAPPSLAVPDTPAAQVSPSEVDNLLKKYGGSK